MKSPFEALGRPLGTLDRTSKLLAVADLGTGRHQIDSRCNRLVSINILKEVVADRKKSIYFKIPRPGYVYKNKLLEISH